MTNIMPISHKMPLVGPHRGVPIQRDIQYLIRTVLGNTGGKPAASGQAASEAIESPIFIRQPAS